MEFAGNPFIEASLRWRVLVENFGVSVYVEPMGEDDTRGLSVSRATAHLHNARVRPGLSSKE